MAEETNTHHHQLHVVMFPWLAFGHIIPYLELAKLISQKGHRISFISTPQNIQRLLPNNSHSSSSLIDFISLPLPRHANLPESAESTMDVQPHLIPSLKLAYDGLRHPLAAFLKNATPDWIIYDFAPHWLPELADKYGVSRAFFSIFPSYCVAFFGPSSSMVDGGEDPRASEPVKFTVNPEWVPFPSKVAYRLHEVDRSIGLFKEDPDGGVSDRFRLGSTIRGCDVYLARSSEELESPWLDLVKELNRRPVVPVGVMPPSSSSLAVHDNSGSAWRDIESWLAIQGKGSVVYVALGSEVVLTRDELTELAHGLELSGSPFLWALRKQRRPTGLTESNDDSFKLQDGFEDRVKGRGVVWTSWAPQLRILSHESVGGFLTHCGWSSVIEGLGFGQPLIMLPVFGDQPLNARVVQEEMKAGVEIERDERDGSVSRDSVAYSVKSVMEGAEGKGYREKAKEMGKKVFGNKELQEKYTEGLVEYLQRHCKRHIP